MTDATPTPLAPSASRRTRYIVAAVICVLVVGGLLWFGLSRNIVYFRTASEAVNTRTATGSARFRLAGAVVPGSVRETADGVEFQVTDGATTVPVVHKGDPPELFKEGAPVVCEGNWSKGAAFDSDRIMIKHGNEYTPPTVSITTPTPAAPGS